MKVGILTYHRAHNYGAFLQAIALCIRLNMEPNIDAEIIDFRMSKEADLYSVSNIDKFIKYCRPIKARFYRIKHDAFEKAQLKMKQYYSDFALTSDSNEELLKGIRGRYEVIIVGSDEVWKADGYRGFPTPYWLPGDYKCRKVTYAVSSRTDFSGMDYETRRLIEEYVNDFEYIGVREKITIDRLCPFLNNKSLVHLNPDPSFLYDFDLSFTNIQKIYKKYRISNKKRKIVLVSNIGLLNKKIAIHFNRKYQLISLMEYNLGYKNIADISPFEWLAIIKDADLVIASYFHATCFSIIFNTPFITFGSKERSSKIEELFENSYFSDRYIKDTKECLSSHDFIKTIEDGFKPIDGTEYVNKCRESFDKDFLKVIFGE